MKSVLLVLALIAADKPPQAPPVRCCPPQAPSLSEMPYRVAYYIAILQRRPLIVFVGQPVRDLPGCLACGEGSFPGVSGRGVVVSRPLGGGRLARLADLSGTPSDAAILSILNRPASVAGLRAPAPAVQRALVPARAFFRGSSSRSC